VSDLNLPLGWVETTLGSALISVVGGGTPSRKIPAYFDGSIPWFTVKDMKALKPNDSEEHISEAAIADSATNLIPANTLIVATRIALGRAIRPTVACAINQDLKALVLGGGINSDFLLHWIGANERVIQDLGSGTTVSGIRLETLHGLPLLLPPSAEQTRIVEKLEELLSDLDAGVTELKAAKKKLAQYRQSLLKAAVEGALTAEWRKNRKVVRPEPVEGPSSVHASTSSARTDESESGAQLLERILQERRTRWEAKQTLKFAEQGKTPPKGWQDKYPEPVRPDPSELPELPEGWDWATIDQIAQVGTGVTPLRSKSAYFNEGTVPWVTSGALNSETVSSATELVTELALKECRLEIYPAGSLLVAMYGEGKTRGKCSELLIPATINQAIAAIVLEPEAQSSKAYLKVFLLDSYERMRAQASGGVQPNLNLQIVKSIALPLPPNGEQSEITQLLDGQFDQISQQQIAVELSLKQSAAQRKNILKAAFSGQLVPQDPNDEPASALLERIRAERTQRDAVKKPRGRKARETVTMAACEKFPPIILPTSPRC